MNVQLVWRLAPRKLQCGWPKQGVEVNNVLANKVNLFGVAFRVNDGVVIKPCFFAIGFERCQIPDGGIEPDVEILARRIGNLNAKVRRVT